MKRLTRQILLVTLVLCPFIGAANPSIISTMEKSADKGRHHLSISNENGIVIYSGRVDDQGQLIELFDFTNLENGIYKVELNKDFVIEITTVEVKNGQAQSLQNSRKDIYKPVFRAQKSKLLISKLALDSSEMEIELYYENQLIHKEAIKGEAILNRVYKLDRRVNGNYKAIMKANNRVYVENFSL